MEAGSTLLVLVLARHEERLSWSSCSEKPTATCSYPALSLPLFISAVSHYCFLIIACYPFFHPTPLFNAVETKLNEKKSKRSTIKAGNQLTNQLTNFQALRLDHVLRSLLRLLLKSKTGIVVLDELEPTLCRCHRSSTINSLSTLAKAVSATIRLCILTLEVIYFVTAAVYFKIVIWFSLWKGNKFVTIVSLEGWVGKVKSDSYSSEFYFNFN